MKWLLKNWWIFAIFLMAGGVMWLIPNAKKEVVTVEPPVVVEETKPETKPEPNKAWYDPSRLWPF